MTKRMIALQLFANFDEIVAANTAAFEGSNLGESVKTLSEKLSGLGYDVLFNNKKSAEFVPSSRLSEVATQRDTFKNQATELDSQLKKMIEEAKGNEPLQAQLQKLQDANTGLLKDLESTRINSEIMLSATDAINAKDVLVFINYDAIKTNAKGEVLGVEAEIARLKLEKPYLFQGDEATRKKKGGSDPNNDQGNPKNTGMNSMIRRAAGKL